MAFPVKWFSSDFRGAPVINGQAGSLIGALEACLLTGFGEITATSVTVSGGIATATHNSGDWFADYAVIAVSGATPAELNGEARVLSHTATTTTWATTAADGAATGVIKIRYAPVGGWEVSFSKTNVRVFRSTDPQANGHYLRVDDTGTTTARVRGYEVMSDVDTGSGPFPTDAIFSGGGHWHKSSVANANATRWMLFGDSRCVYPVIAAGTGGNASFLSAPLRGFGDAVALRPGGDGWSTFLSYASASISSSYSSSALSGGADGGVSGSACVSPRSWQGIGAAILMYPRPYVGAPISESGADSSLGPTPNPIDGSINLSGRFLSETANDPSPRSNVPGVLYIPQKSAISLLSWGDTMDGGGSLMGRRLMAGLSGARGDTSATGVYLMDITGPWR